MNATESSKRPTIILAPHAGGDSLSYAPLLRHLKEDGEAFFYEIAGHGQRATEQTPNSYRELIESFADFIIEKTQDTDKYMICGDSMGAYMCDNVYTELKRRGYKLPCHVIYASVDIDDDAGDLSLDEIKEKSLSKIMLDANNAYAGYILEILEKDVKLLTAANASFSAVLDCELSFFMGKNDKLVGGPEHDLNRIAPKGYREYLFEGGHLFITSNKNVASTINKIRDRYRNE